jgi:DNA-binding NtrC family response regulator
MADRILIVEDERLIRSSLAERLQTDGFEVSQAESGAAFRRAMKNGLPDLVLMDVRLPDADGTALLAELADAHPEIPVILMTAYSTVEKAVAAMKRGAWDYLNKPFDLDEMVLEVGKALEMTRLRREVQRLREAARERLGGDTIIAQNPKMREILELVTKVAASGTSTVLLRGESGTGKDLMARAIHDGSPRRDRPFMTVTCSAIPEALLESELFGHERGAFTDAKQAKKGIAELADGGTLFLDEIGDMPAGLQAKILRLLEDKRFKRVGGVEDLTVDVRIVAATNRDLERAVRDKSFREDLYYRLKIIPIEMPPLRERPEDVPLLLQHFVERFAKEFRKPMKRVAPSALDALVHHHWPGNIRELRNAVERAMILGSPPELRLSDFPPEIVRPAGAPAADPGRFALPPEGLSLEELERDLVRQALERAHGNRTRAGRLLGLNRDAVRYRIEKFGLDFPPPGGEEDA